MGAKTKDSSCPMDATDGNFEIQVAKKLRAPLGFWDMLVAIGPLSHSGDGRDLGFSSATRALHDALRLLQGTKVYPAAICVQHEY
jgi:hypothetical protein